jgi:hypothetical protein
MKLDVYLSASGINMVVERGGLGGDPTNKNGKRQD